MSPIANPEDFATLVGTTRGPGAWLTIDQDAVNDFARLTHDPQWIHVDLARAAASPFGGTIVHGFFTLSLVAHWVMDLFPTTDEVVTINYGLNRVRFLAPVRVGSRLRMSAKVSDCTMDAGAARVEFEATVESEGGARPACVASPVLLFRPA